MYNALNPPTDEKKQAIRQSGLFGAVEKVSKKLRLEPEPKPKRAENESWRLRKRQVRVRFRFKIFSRFAFVWSYHLTPFV